MIADAVKFAVVEKLDAGGDRDGNGLPDDWERRHFLQLTGTDPNADPDGDNRSNLQEFRDRTDPNVIDEPLVGSFLPVKDLSVGDVRVVLRWPGREGEVYRIDWTKSLQDDFLPLGDKIFGINGEMTVALPKGTSSSAFFRIHREFTREE